MHTIGFYNCFTTIIRVAFVAHWIRHRLLKPRIASSSPVIGTIWNVKIINNFKISDSYIRFELCVQSWVVWWEGSHSAILLRKEWVTHLRQMSTRQAWGIDNGQPEATCVSSTLSNVCLLHPKQYMSPPSHLGVIGHITATRNRVLLEPGGGCQSMGVRGSFDSVMINH